jgi:DNA helicase-2/ATP-dependent DNA helicase PcrA
MVSGVEFFRRQEVKDVLAFARLVENPKDDAAFSRIVNVPRRGVGEGSLERLRERATAARTSLAEAAADAPELPRKAREGLASLLATLERLRALPRSPVAPLLDAVVRETGYRDDLLARDDDVERSRAENVAELLAAADEADAAFPGQDLRAFLERASLASDQDAYEEGSGRVSLMTAHAAKGLEFDRVVIAAAEEGCFPHERNAHAPEEVEEERRLFYVAMTRARERLAVTHAAWRQGWQGAGRRRPSRFLDDVPEDLVEVVDRTGFLGARGRRDLAWSRGRTSWGVPPEGPPDGDDETVWRRGAAEELRPGDLVTHTHFGHGRVAALSGTGRDLRVTVDFEDVGTKTILWEYACLARRNDDARD